MEALLVVIIGVCACVSLSLTLINCLRCHKKVSEEDLQQKYFEKFRKKHMKARDRVLTNRVDVVRPRTDSQVSSTSCEGEHTYQSIGSICDPRAPNSDHMPRDCVPTDGVPIDGVAGDAGVHDDHSFFDESFQTVVEASSYNMTGLTDCKNDGNHLSVSTNLASYISFQQHRLSSSCFPILDQSEKRSAGEVNLAFNGGTIPRGHRGRLSQDSLEEDYIVPNQGPKICVTQHSARKIVSKNQDENDLDIVSTSLGANTGSLYPTNNLESDKYIKMDPSMSNKFNFKCTDGGFITLPNNGSKSCVDVEPFCERPDYVCHECENVGSLSETSRKVKLCQGCNKICSKCHGNTCADSKCRNIYMEKLRIEGKSYFSRPSPRKRHEKKSKGKTKLIIPQMTVECDSTFSSSKDNTYESIGSVLAEGALRRDSVEMVAEDSSATISKESRLTSGRRRSSSDCDHTYESIMSKSCEDLISSIAKDCDSDISSGASRTGLDNVGNGNKDNYTKPSKRSASDSDTAVVIIGRKVSQRYRPILPTGDNNSDFKMWNSRLELQDKLSHTYKSPSKSRRDSLERYSPFPSSTKKLAFKTPFKQAASPRFPMMQLKSGNLKPTFLTELLNSATKNIGIENFNIETPEMKVKDSPKVFTIDRNVFISPMVCFHKNDQSPAVIDKKQPISLPQTFFPTPISGMHTVQSEPIRKSLPSLPDDLEIVLENHCSEGVNAMSTPTV